MAQTSTTLLASKSHIADKTLARISVLPLQAQSTRSAVQTSTAEWFWRYRDDNYSHRHGQQQFNIYCENSEFGQPTDYVEEIVTTETSDGSTTITLDHTGFVSDKTKGDGYYSQPDGVHTVAYQVNSTMTGSIKMQGHWLRHPRKMIGLTSQVQHSPRTKAPLYLVPTSLATTSGSGQRPPE
jgi:hypothetical protein